MDAKIPHQGVNIASEFTILEVVCRHSGVARADLMIRRRANSSRISVVMRAALGEPGKRGVAGDEGTVEILGAGQQTVVDGWHASGARLEWQNPLWDVPFADVPSVTEGQIDLILQEIQSSLLTEARLAPAADAKPSGQTGKTRFIENLLAFPKRPPLLDDGGLSTGIETNIEEIRSAVDSIPSTAIASENDWVKFARGMAYHARIYSSQEPDLFAIFDAASRQAPNYNEAENLDRWQRYQDQALACDNPITIGTIFALARKYGWLWSTPPTSPLTPAGSQVAAVTTPGNLDPLRFGTLPTSDAVARINTEYLVLRISGKIYRQGADGELSALSKQNFQTALGGRWVEKLNQNGKRQLSPAADAWLASSDRREFTGLQYCPDNIGLKPNHLNLFQRWGDVAPAAGDCSAVLNHVREIIADGNDAKAEYLLDWFADILQNPARKPGVCIILRGGHGTGKSVLVLIMRRVLGSANVFTTGDKDRILGRFNAAIGNKILLVGEEVIFSGDRATADRLKHLITGQTIQIEFKFGDALEIDSSHRLLLTSNHDHVVQAAGDERRFVTYDVSDHKRGDADYFEALYAVAEGRDDSAAAAFKKFLLDRDLSGFSPWKGQQAFAADAALASQKELSLSPPLAWLHEVMNECATQLQAGESVSWYDGLPLASSGLGAAKICKWPPKFTRRDAVDGFQNWVQKSKPRGASDFTGSQAKFWAELHRIIPQAKTSSKDAAGNRVVSIDLADLRSNFDKFFKGQTV